MNHQHQPIRIVADSAADRFTLTHVPFAAAPLKVVTDEREFLDVSGTDIAAMVSYLKTYKGRSTTSCPNPNEWLQAFGDAKTIVGVALTSGLSGSYNAAQIATQLYKAEHPDRNVFILDSLSAGPGETILIEKLEELVLAGMEYDAICREIEAYRSKTGLIFILESLTNFANNGRISPAVAKFAGLLGICIVGQASAQGTLEPLEKCRGQKKSLEALISLLQKNGYRGGKIRIAHCFNEDGAHKLQKKIQILFPTANITIHSTNALCSFYAEKGGLLIGYETI